MDSRLLPVVGTILMGLCAVVVASWSFSVETEPTEIARPTPAPPTPVVSRPLSLSSAPDTPQAERRGQKGARKGKAKAKGRKAKSAEGAARLTEAAPPRPERDPLEREELAWARREYREERVIDMNDRLDAFAAEVDWDEETTEEVRALLVDSMDKISKQLARVDKGHVEWDEVKADLRDFRESRARELERYLGPDEFAGFVDGMAFERFYGEEPIRGRLDGRPRRQGRGQQ